MLLYNLYTQFSKTNTLLVLYPLVSCENMPLPAVKLLNIRPFKNIGRKCWKLHWWHIIISVEKCIKLVILSWSLHELVQCMFRWPLTLCLCYFQYNVRSYPTTILYNQSVPHHYHGHHNVHAMVEFIQVRRKSRGHRVKGQRYLTPGQFLGSYF